MPDGMYPNAKAQSLARSILGESMVAMGDIAVVLGVTYRCVQSWRKQGVLPPPDFAQGKVVRWRRSTIERFLKTRSAAGAEE